MWWIEFIRKRTTIHPEFFEVQYLTSVFIHPAPSSLAPDRLIVWLRYYQAHH